MDIIEQLQQRYTGAAAWAFGDSPALADELAALVIAGKKRASCGSLASFRQEPVPPTPGGYNIILSGTGQPLCVIKTVALRLIRFSEVTEALASMEGEGDLSLEYWRQEHQRYFQRQGYWSEDMDLVFEEFELVEVL